MFALICQVQLALDSLDRLVDTLEERGPLTAVEAARSLFATPSISAGLASSLLGELTAGDSRVACLGGSVALAGGCSDPVLEEAEFVVFDLETTGLSASRDRICELGAVRVRGLELVDSFESLVNPGIALPEPVARLTGLRQQELVAAPPAAAVVRRFLDFADEALLVAHNAGFDQRFLEQHLLALYGRRLSEPPLCTAALARRLLEGRLRRVGLASLAHFFGVPTAPCHRALPDAEATAQVLVRLIGLSQELGARRLSSYARSPRRASAAYTTSARSREAPRRGRASTSSTTATDRCSTSAGRATCGRGCGPTSAASGSVRRSRPHCWRSTGSSGACSALSSRRRSKSCG